MKQTLRGAYCETPHKTIGELQRMAVKRVKQGEAVDYVVQDIVNGYSLEWQSANHYCIAFGLEGYHETT